jgi:hypothetical protein
MSTSTSSCEINSSHGPDRFHGQGVTADREEAFFNYMEDNRLTFDTEQLAQPIIKSLSQQPGSLCAQSQPIEMPPKSKQKFVPKEFRSSCNNEPANKLCDAFPLLLPTAPTQNKEKLKSGEKTNNTPFVFDESLAEKAQKIVLAGQTTNRPKAHNISPPDDFFSGEFFLDELFPEECKEPRTAIPPCETFPKSKRNRLPPPSQNIPQEALEKHEDEQGEFYWHIADQRDLQKKKKELEVHVKNLNNPTYQQVYLECSKLEDTGKLENEAYLKASGQYLQMAARGQLDNPDRKQAYRTYLYLLIGGKLDQPFCQKEYGIYLNMLFADKLEDPDHRQAYEQYLTALVAGMLKSPIYLENYKNYLTLLTTGKFKNPIFRAAYEKYLGLLLTGKLENAVYWMAYENYLRLISHGELENPNYLQAYEKYLGLLLAGKLNNEDYRQTYQQYLKRLVAGQLDKPALVQAYQKKLDSFAAAQSEEASRRNVSSRNSGRGITAAVSVKERNPRGRTQTSSDEVVPTLRVRSKSRENISDKAINSQASSPRSPRDLSVQRQRRPSKENKPAVIQQRQQGEPVSGKPGVRKYDVN